MLRAWIIVVGTFWGVSALASEGAGACRSLEDRLIGSKEFATCVADALAPQAFGSYVSFGTWSYSGFVGRERAPLLKLQVWTDDSLTRRLTLSYLVVAPRSGQFARETWKSCAPFSYRPGLGDVATGVASFDPAQVSLEIYEASGNRALSPRGLAKCLRKLDDSR